MTGNDQKIKFQIGLNTPKRLAKRSDTIEDCEHNSRVQVKGIYISTTKKKLSE